MRIIGGKFRGRRFNPPADKWPTRPTTDFAKEALFNILENTLDFSELRFLDLFGGTGNHSFECISRGCTDVTYVDKFYPCTVFVKKLAAQLQMEQYLKVVRGDALKFMKTNRRPFDYIFAGPPYPLPELGQIPDRLFANEVMLASGGLFVLEHNQHHNFDEHPNFQQVRKYGQTHFSFFTKD